MRRRTGCAGRWEIGKAHVCPTRRFSDVGVSRDSPILWVLTPGLLMLAWAGTLLLLFDAPPNWLRWPVGAVFFGLQVAYLGFRLVATLSLDTIPNAICSI